MEVIEKDHQLIVRTHWFAGCALLLFGLVFAVVGLGALWLGGRAATLTCTRPEAAEVRCEIKQTVLGITLNRIEVTNPQRAIIQAHEDSDGDTTYRVALVTASGSVPLTENYTSDSVTDLASQINQFLSNRAVQSLALDQPPVAWIFLFPLFFTGFGVLMIVNIRFDSYIFDRSRGALFIQHDSLRGTRQRQEPLDRLQAVVCEDRANDGGASYRVHLLLAMGSNIVLGQASSSASAAQKLADRITEFVKPGARIRYVDVK